MNDTNYDINYQHIVRKRLIYTHKQTTNKDKYNNINYLIIPAPTAATVILSLSLQVVSISGNCGISTAPLTQFEVAILVSSFIS